MSTPDPSSLDFTDLVEEQAPPPPLRETPTPVEEEEALIGSRALGTDGFHLIAARRSGQAAADPSTQVVLVVDDDLATGELAARVLRRAGFQAAVVGNPRDAARHMSRLGPAGPRAAGRRDARHERVRLPGAHARQQAPQGHAR